MSPFRMEHPESEANAGAIKDSTVVMTTNLTAYPPIEMPRNVRLVSFYFVSL